MRTWSRWKCGFAGFVALAFSAGAVEADALDPLAECNAYCRAVKERLSETDNAELGQLPAQVRATLAEISERSTAGNDAKADDLAAKLSGENFDGKFDKVKSGRRACTVYWYGFLDEGSRRVGRHQCRVAVKNGQMTISKVTGDGLTAVVYPYVSPVQAFVGRTYLEDHKQRSYDRETPANAENENFGNKVGVVLADKGRLYLVSINENGFTEPDETFFEIMALE